MQKVIELGNKKIAYTLKRNRRARNLRLSICQGGRLKVSAPWVFPEFAIKNFIRKKSDWILEKMKEMEKYPAPSSLRSQNELEYRKLKRRAFLIAYERLKHFNVHYGFSYRKITIRDQKTRWGSCSARGTLSYNYKIAILPEKLSDYIIVHELCHIGEFNHSERFWKLVEKTIPDFREIRRELRKKYF